MSRSLHSVLVLTLALCPLSVFGQTPTSKPDEAGWKKLFDGKSLDGWKAADFGGEGKVARQGRCRSSWSRARR